LKKSRHEKYDLVIFLNYYAPYVSGLTEVARVVAEGCAARGWRVHVVACRHDRSLPTREIMNGVSVERVRVIARVRNGVISPAFPVVSLRRARQARLVNPHMPMLEAGPIVLGLGSRPVVSTYQCDYVTGDDGVLGTVIKHAIDLSSRIALRRSASVVVTSEDYAQSSRVYLSMRGREVAIAPPFNGRAGGKSTFRRSSGFHIGSLGRVVHEKGLDILIRAFRQIPDADARLLIAGDHARVAGPSVIEQLRELAAGDSRIEFLGYLDEADVPDFLASLDVLAFPSINSLEAFGIVQLEAISAGVPVIASDLPGVRLPVLQTGFGLLVPPGDLDMLLDALQRIRTMKFQPPDLGTSSTVDQYMSVFEAALRRRELAS
jgi:glycosyltransferase involved in cell wall biosynthesis